MAQKITGADTVAVTNGILANGIPLISDTQ